MSRPTDTNPAERLANKRVLLGVTGSIAAYKAGELVRRLRDTGAEVRVVMTRAAGEFVTPLTFQALSGHPVHQHLLDSESEAAMGHIELARWADVILVAPASADFIARLRAGRADDLLMAVCLAGEVPLAVAPAMNRQMWQDPATEDNIRVLRSRGVVILGPDEGAQACGEVGPGRMLEPVALLPPLGELFEAGSLTGKRVLISAGPTHEALDPVRYLTNASSGKMGYALAEAAWEAGAQVTLVSGPVHLQPPPGVRCEHVVSAQQMFETLLMEGAQHDIFVAAAAVADYRPASSAPQKIKKGDERISLELVRNPDILTEMKRQYPQLFCVGFAAETEDLLGHARDKLYRKQADLIAANWVGPAAPENEGTFGADSNALRVLWREQEVELPLAPKTKLARQLISIIAERCAQQGVAAEDNANIVSFRNNKNDS
jgi:phosphopantothenoylcysteine decarboxylase/phosphopantothenate--cysteine ligase